jgi:TolB-like protein/Flp pilus assembly protein TadD
LIGETLNQFEVTAKIGEGGMGAVYRARDTRLGRDVAIKVLPEDVAGDVERLARFEREARLLASLNHPNIATLHGLEESGGRLFLVMELIEGETLARRLLRGPLPLEEALPLFRQIGDALAAAHRKDVVHRDLKPSNIQITPEGRAKLLDFGLAKAFVGGPAGEGSRTLSLGRDATRAGVLVGTVPYMSPEQVRGQLVDSRTDVWAFGCCLFASLSGRTLFRGETDSDTLAQILTQEPDWNRLPDSTPRAIRRLLKGCLEKDRNQRLSSVDEALSDPDLDESSELESEATLSSVAALPFRTVGGDPDTEIFADGMTEDVIAQLAKVAGLKVIARGSVMALKERRKSLREIGELLGVATVLDGSIRRAGQRVRIVVQLIEAASERPVWSETYDRDLDDIFAVQSDVALRVASALSAELSSDVQDRIEKRPTENLDAYRLFLEGRHCLLRATGDGIRSALELFGRAIRLDPGYALAHAGMAMAYVWVGFGMLPGLLKPREAYARAEDAARSAVELDPDLGYAHSMRGFVRMVFHFDWECAEEDMRRGVELSPGNPEGAGVLGLLLSALSRHEEAIEVTRRALALDPLTSVLSSDLATKYLRAGRFDEAIDEASRLLTLEPEFPMAHSTLGWAYLKTGRTEEGLRELSLSVESAPGNTMLLAQLGQAYGEVGKLDEARSILDEMSVCAAEQHVSPYHLAYVHIGLGDLDRAVECLNQAFEERSAGLYGVKGSFLFAPLGSHPGFRALLRRMHLA